MPCRKSTFPLLPGIFLRSLEHGLVLSQCRVGFRGPCFQLYVIPTLCLSFERSDVFFMDFVKQRQIRSVEIRGAEVLCPYAAGIERDAFAVGQSSKLLIDSCMVGHHACADVSHLRAFSLFL